MNTKTTILKATLLTTSLLFAAPTFASDDFVGAGASFPKAVYNKWAKEYKAATGKQLKYLSIGSGGGVKQIKAKQVDFGASDKPLKFHELEAAGLMQFPAVVGGVVPTYNLPSIDNEELRLDGKVLANIYLGAIKKWNDPAIKALNPSVKLPDLPITVVHRSDGSGTTFLFTNYLSKVSKKWDKKVGADKKVKWPVGKSADGNDGVAETTKANKGAIGYVGYSYAVKNKLHTVSMKNLAGKFAKPTPESFKAAAQHAQWSNAPGFYQILTNQPGKATWPIAGATFILMHKKQADPETALEVLKFFDYAYERGDASAKALNYIPMPNNVVNVIHFLWERNIKTKDGKSIWKN